MPSLFRLWLKRDSLHMLGLEPEIDQKRLNEETGPAQDLVVTAYERALEARKLVMGDASADPDDDEQGRPPIIDQYGSSDEGSEIAVGSKRRASLAARSGRARTNSEDSL